LELLFSRALYMPDKHSTMELYPNSLFLEFWEQIYIAKNTRVNL
jgi:hypothetical protein